MASILAVGVFVTAGQAAAATVAVLVDPAVPRFEDRGSLGYLVPGRGPDFSRAEIRRALEGVERCTSGCRYRVVVWYEGGDSGLIGVSGPGYPRGGLLVSTRTRVPGVISIYDVKPTVEALDRGERPTLRGEATADAEGRLSALSDRLYDLDRTRTAASLALVAVVLAFALVGRLRRWPLFSRAALLAIPATLASALALSALEVSEPQRVVPLLALLGGGGALLVAAIARTRLALGLSLAAIFAVYLVVLSVSTETSSLAVIGPRPENGGRFYGFNNQLETLLLVPGLLGAVFLPLLVVAGLALLTVGASFAGADGGGILVFGAAFLFLWMRLRRVPLTARNLALAAGAVVAGGLALVGLDAAFGGESHVTRAVGSGPGSLIGDIADRVAASAVSVVTNWHTAVVVAISVPVLVWLGLRRPRYAVVDALLVALAVSLVANDAPREVLGFGAVSATALRFWCEVAEPVE